MLGLSRILRRPTWAQTAKILKLIGLVIFVLILINIDWGEFLSHLLRTNPFWIFAWTATAVTSAWIRAVRWKILIQCMGHNVGIGRLYMYTIEGAMLGMVTPGRLGELGKATFLIRDGVPIGIGATTVIVDRVIDVFALVLLGSVGFLLLRDIHPSFTAIGFSGLVCLFTGIAIAVGLDVRPILVRFFPKSLSIRLDHMKMLGSRTPQLLVLTGVNLLLFFTMCWSAAKAAGIDIGILKMGFLGIIASLISMAPISINGIGTRDAFYVFSLGHYEIASSQSLYFSLLDGIVLSILGLVLQYALAHCVLIFRRGILN